LSPLIKRQIPSDAHFDPIEIFIKTRNKKTLNYFDMCSLFETLASLTKKDNGNEVRQKICNYMILNGKVGSLTAEEQVRLRSNMDLTLYTAQMRQPDTPASLLELEVFCELYPFVISVYFHELNHPLRCYGFRATGYRMKATLQWNIDGQVKIISDVTQRDHR